MLAELQIHTKNLSRRQKDAQSMDPLCGTNVHKGMLAIQAKPRPVTVAPAAIMPGTLSAAGEALQRFPAGVARD